MQRIPHNYIKTRSTIYIPSNKIKSHKIKQLTSIPIFKIGDEVIWARGTRSECPARITKKNKNDTYNIRYHTGWLKGKLRRNISGQELSKKSKARKSRKARN